MNDITDMRGAIIPKSDQINADDLLAGPRTITIRDVKIASTEQPVSIYFDGDQGKPWKPCKSMSRVLVHAWGPDAKKYIGRSVTLYCDPKVTWGGMAVGGIRVSHMSHIDREMMMALTATKGKRAPFMVKPLASPGPQTANGGDQQASNQPSDAPSTGTKPTETIGFVSWEGDPFEYPRTLAGIEEYAAAFRNAFALAVDKAAWFKDNQAVFHELAVGAVGSRGKSARCEKLAALFDTISAEINDALAGGAA